MLLLAQTMLIQQALQQSIFAHYRIIEPANSKEK
jgi:hypothetical protein